MPPPVACIRCSRPSALVSPAGLCPECATAVVTLRGDPPVAAPPEPADDPRPLPASPPGHELVRRLGGGGMGEVYLARERASERLVALKFLKHPGDPSQFDRFVVELKALARLDHPNVVRVYSSDVLRADPYFTMEYVPGGSLARLGSLPAAAAVRLVRAAAVGVGAAHAAGVVHRDLKPGNILLGPDGQPRVADFGLAKRLDAADPLTAASGGLGTPGYMPPEQISRRNGAVGPWSDVYGLGATLYHLLVGHAPFVGDTVADTVSKVLADPPPRPRAVRPDVPAGLEGIVLKCLEKDPKDRYPSMAELVADLDDWAAGREPAAPRLTRWRRLRRWVVRNRRAAAAAAALAAAATGLVGAGRALAPVPPVPPVPPADVTPDEVRGPDGRRLPFRVRLGHDKSKVSVAADGTLTVSSWGLCLVEYTPAGPRPERYHFAARVRHERSDLSGQVGVYFAHRAEPGPYGDRHLFGRVSYNDLLSPADKVQAAARPVPVPIRPALENRARIGLIAVLPGPSGQWSGADWFAADRPFRVAGSVADRWRAVGVTAAADGASGAWEGEPFGHIPAARLAGAFASELDRARRLAPAHPPPAAAEYDPAGGVGLYVEQSSASFREVAVTAADARGLLP